MTLLVIAFVAGIVLGQLLGGLLRAAAALAIIGAVLYFAGDLLGVDWNAVVASVWTAVRSAA